MRDPAAVSISAISLPLVLSRKRNDLRTFAWVVRPCSMASPRRPRSSVRRKTSATSRAAASPLAPIAMPTSAPRSAGLSLIPSPIIATTAPEACSALTTLSFCAGVIRPNPCARGAAAINAAASSPSHSLASTISSD